MMLAVFTKDGARVTSSKQPLGPRQADADAYIRNRRAELLGIATRYEVRAYNDDEGRR